METVFKMPFGTYEGYQINSRRIPTQYLVQLEEHLLLEKKESTSKPIMKALDAEIRRRHTKKIVRVEDLSDVEHSPVISDNHKYN